MFLSLIRENESFILHKNGVFPVQERRLFFNNMQNFLIIINNYCLPD
jgi:hypothetical protein